MYELVIGVANEYFYLGYILLVVGLFFKSRPGVVPLLILGVSLAAFGEWMYWHGEWMYWLEDTFWVGDDYSTPPEPVQWVRFAAFLSWGVAIFVGWPGRSGSGKSSTRETESSTLLPIIPVNEKNFVVAAEHLRDQISDWFEQVATERKLDLQLVASPPYQASPYVRAELHNAAPRDSGVEYVANATIRINSEPFHQFEQICDVDLDTGLKRKHFSGVVGFQANDAARILEILTSEKKIRDYRPKRIRNWFFQIWRTKNKLTACKRRDPHAVLKTLAAFFPPLLFFIKKQPVYRLSTGKPEEEPRNLARMDSWQTVIEKIGYGGRNLTLELEASLRESMPQEIRIKNEKVWYWGPSGKVERKQMVVGLRRAIAFVHIYEYGDDLYVGWDAHVNCGAWSEDKVASGFSTIDGLPLQLYSVKPAWYGPNEYDIYDANFIIESVHAALTKIVRKLLKEFKIDQEIDFSIVRESRKDVMSTEDPNASASKKKRFKRLG